MRTRKPDNQTSPEAVADSMACECIAWRIRLLSRVITRLYDDAVRSLGLRSGQVSILAALTKRGPSTASDLRDVLMMEKSTLSRNLDRMQQQGWIDSTPGEDARCQLLSITSAGQRLLVKAYPNWQNAQATVQKLLGGNSLEALNELAGAARSIHHA